MGREHDKYDFAELARRASKEPWILGPKLSNALVLGGALLALFSFIGLLAGLWFGLIGLLVGAACCAFGSREYGIWEARKWTELAVSETSAQIKAYAACNLSFLGLTALPVACVAFVLALVFLPSLLLLIFIPVFAVSAYFFINPLIILTNRHKLNKIEGYQWNLAKEAFLTIQDLSDIRDLEKLFPNFVQESIVAAHKCAQMVLHDVAEERDAAQDVLERIEAFSEAEYT